MINLIGNICIFVVFYILYKTYLTNKIMKESERLMLTWNLFIRCHGDGKAKKYYICWDAEGKIWYQQYKQGIGIRYSTKSYGTNVFTNDIIDQIVSLLSGETEMQIRRKLVRSWKDVVQLDKVQDIHPTVSKKTNDLMSKLVKAEMDGDKAQVEILFSEYLKTGDVK